MFVIAALHPVGWRSLVRASLKSWTDQDAQTRWCSGGRKDRIVNAISDEIVALVNTWICRARGQLIAQQLECACGPSGGEDQASPE